MVEVYEASDSDREAVVGNLRYEIEQMRRARTLLDQNILEEGPDAWLLAEAGLLHARNVMEFLFFRSMAVSEERASAGVRPTASAEWFLSPRDWRTHERRRQFEEQLGIDVREVKRRMDRRVFHLALDRDDVPRVHLAELVENIETSLTSFLFRLSDRWKQQLPAPIK